MFFFVRKIKGIPYLYKVNPYRDDKTGVPTNSSKYIGTVSKIETAINRWREKHGN